MTEIDIQLQFLKISPKWFPAFGLTYDKHGNPVFSKDFMRPVGLEGATVGFMGQCDPDPEDFISSTRRFAGKEDYKKILEKLRFEISKLVKKGELFRGRLANWRLANYLGLPWGERSEGRKWDTISTISKGKRHITQDDFITFKESLTKFFGERSIDIIKYIEGFLNNDNFRKHSKQSWHLYNPKLKADFFSGLVIENYQEANIRPSYWYGFMGSDASLQSGYFEQAEESKRDHRYRYQITIELSKRDRGFLVKFCNDLGLDPLRIKDRNREKWGEIYHQSYITFNCREMTEDFESLEFASCKNLRRGVPNYVKKAMELAYKSLNRKYTGPEHITSTISGKIALSWLRGYYDGDGHSDRTEIGSASKMFLESVRRVFKIKHPVRPHPSAENFWILSLGARLFNSMTSVCIEYDLGLKRKNDHFSESREALDILKEKLEDLGVNREVLQLLVYQYTQNELVKAFDTTIETFRALRNEWGVELPPRGYWYSSDKDKFLGKKV